MAAFGQVNMPDTIITLEQVTVKGSRQSALIVGHPIESVDSADRLLMPAGTLADLVSGMPSLHIKNYGSGTLTTVSMRGTSANHTGLVWNGIPITPPNIGYPDLSFVRGDFFNGINVLYGGASPVFGSGHIGGTIQVSNETDPAPGSSSFNFGTTAGSLGQVDARGSYAVSGNRISSRTAAFWKYAANSFPYEDLGGEKRQLEHAGQTGTGIIQDFAFRLNNEQVFSASGWFQYSDRDIPPTLTESESDANQLDRSLRIMASWKDVNRTSMLEAKAAYFNEFERYSDPRFDVYSTIATQTALAQFESSWSLFKLSRFFAGTGITYNLGNLSAYIKPQQEYQLAFFASFLQPVPGIGWEFVVHLRQEFLTSYKSPFIFGLSGQGTIIGPLSMKWSFSRNFRAPTMNERFWQPGGNEDLDPEESWNGDLTFLVRQPAGTAVIELRTTVFSSMVDNWIMWVPGESFWSVENIQKVWARGFEVSAGQDLMLDGVNLSLLESYSYTRSTNEQQLGPNDASYKKQLIYIPVNQGVVKASLGWKGFGFSLKNTVTGEVFTTRDNATSLPAYVLLDAALSKKFFAHRKETYILYISVNNLFNEEYQVTPFRPMPGFNFLVSLDIQFNNQKEQ
jgi:iron complex outermembrane receptor protein